MPRCFLPPVGLWSRPHAKAAVLEDDGLVGHCIVWLWLQLAESVIDVEWSAWYLVLPASCRGMHLHLHLHLVGHSPVSQSCSAAQASY